MQNKKLISNIIRAVAIVLILASVISFTPATHANDVVGNECINDSESSVLDDSNATEDDDIDIPEIMDLETATASKNLVEQEIASLYQQIDALNKEINNNNKLIDQYQKQLKSQVPKLQKRYTENMQTIAAKTQAIIAYLCSIRTDVDTQKMVDETAELGELLNDNIDISTSIDNLQTSFDDESALLNQNQLKLKELQILLLQKKQEACDLMSIIAENDKAVAKYKNKLNSTSDLYEKAVTKALETGKIEIIRSSLKSGGLSLDMRVHDDGTVWASPCAYKRVSSKFGYRKHPITGRRHMHNGVDLTNDAKTPIRATRSGVVVSSGWSDSAGYNVTIDHLDGTKSYYMHLYKKSSLSIGDVVVIGDYIGGMGTTGMSTGVHLHFGIKKDGKYVDPMKLIRNK